jgi:hypothetical protein
MHGQSQEIPLNVTLMLSMDFCMDDGISPKNGRQGVLNLSLSVLLSHGYQPWS